MKSGTPTNRRVEGVLAAIWLIFFFAQLAIAFYIYLRDWIGSEQFGELVKVINSTYVTYVGAVVCFYFGSRKRTASKTLRQASASMVALVCSVAWNVVLLAFTVPLLFSGTVESSIRDIGAIGPMLSWLVAPVIGVYFAKSTE